jgi:hypothetical protein
MSPGAQHGGESRSTPRTNWRLSFPSRTLRGNESLLGLGRTCGRRRGRRSRGRLFGHPAAGDELPRPVGEALPVRRCPGVARPKRDPAAVHPCPLPVLQNPVARLPRVSGSRLRNVNDPWRRGRARAHDCGGEDRRVGGQEEQPRAVSPEASARQDRQENSDMPDGDHPRRPHRSKPLTGCTPRSRCRHRVTQSCRAGLKPRPALDARPPKERRFSRESASPWSPRRDCRARRRRTDPP